MRVLRGRGADPDADAAATATLLERAADGGEVGLRVWRPHRQCSFGRRDVRASGYRRAREAALARDFPPTERDVGGRPIAYTGSTVAIALATPIDDPRSGTAERYESLVSPTQRALWRVGVPAQRGEPANSFCPGRHSLQWNGKVAGFAQRVRRDAALVAGVVIVRDHRAIGDVLAPVYDALGLAFDPDSVGSVARTGGRDDPEEVAREIETALVGDREPTVERVGETAGSPDREG